MRGLVSQVPPPPKKRVKFAPSGDFRATLKRRVDTYLEDQNSSGSDAPQVYLKALILIVTLIVSYYVLVFTAAPIVVKLFAATLCGLTSAGIGFNVMHDAGHGAMSKHKWVNRFFFYSLDFLGASSYFWNIKHNQLHHTYANIEGYDDDIDVGALLRLSPEQPHRTLHRFQHFYIWPLYGFILVKWQIFDDLMTWKRAKITQQDIPRPRGFDVVALLLGKLWLVSVCFIIPMMIYPAVWVICFYLFVLWIEGFVLAVTFQLAHCLEEAMFPALDESSALKQDWAQHQVLTTVDFAPHNKLLTWYVGGLNYQVIHHLFPKISHIHYPQLAPIVEQTCREFELEYKVHTSLGSALKSHFRHLRALALKPELRGVSL